MTYEGGGAIRHKVFVEFEKAKEERRERKSVSWLVGVQ